MELIIAVAVIAALYLITSRQASAQDTVQDLGGNVDISRSSTVDALANAIATAEGFFVEGSRPQRNHNPGDMTKDLINRGIGFDGSFVQFQNDEDGWNNLRAQINAWLNGTSHYHTAESTIADLAGLGTETAYTTTDQSAWAETVAATLGVDVNTPIGEIA